MPVNPEIIVDHRTGKRTVKWLNGAGLNNFAAYSADIAMGLASITIVDDAVDGITFSLLVSNGGAVLTPLADVNGNAITAPGTYEISTAAEIIHPFLSLGIGGNWSVFLTYWG